MARVKRGTTKAKRRRSILSQVKGYRHGRSHKEREAREALAHAGAHAFAHRRKKKNDFRRLWSIRINAAAHQHGFSYSRLINALKQQSIALDRKTLATIAKEKPEAFSRLIAKISQ